jgi:propionate catabolism operon transcriptional regulator
VEAGEFRTDLYYRLNILNIGLPPLRERLTDILPLAAELLSQAARREPRLAARIRTPRDALSVLADISESLSRHAWPGNVRELQNVIERITVELADSHDAALTNEVLQSIAPELFERPEGATVDAASAQPPGGGR